MTQDDLLKDARTYLVQFAQGKSGDNDSIHPWRKSGEFIIYHSLRVACYVERILKVEGQRLSSDEVLLLRLAAVLHDLGTLIKLDEHAEISARLVEEWVSADFSRGEAISDPKRLRYLILAHSNKDRPEPDLAAQILKDADILDEIGIMSIFMSASRLERSSSTFFADLLERLEGRELNYCDRQMARPGTETAKVIMQQKKDFIQGFIEQLEMELCIEERKSVV